jgi:CHAT domain-containing protein
MLKITCLLSVNKWMERFKTFACCLLALCLFLVSCAVGLASRNTVNPSDYLTTNTNAGCEPSVATDLRHLDAGTMIERELAGGQAHSYQISVSEKQFLRVVVEQMGIDVELAFCAPDGTRVARVDRPNGSTGPEAISLIAAQSGAFSLLVKSLDNSTPAARYRIQIAEQRNQQTADDTRINAERAISEGEVQRSRGKLESLRVAVEEFEVARVLWQSLNEPYEEALALYGLGWSHSEIGAYGMVKFPLPVHRLRWSYEARTEHQKAIDCFNRSLELMQQVGSRYGEAIAQADRGWPQLYLDQTKQALESFESAYLYFRDTGNSRGEAKVLYGMGWVHVIQGNDTEALNQFLLSLPRRRASKDRKGEAITLAAISRSQNKLGRNLEALDSAGKALTLFTELKDEHGQASTSSILGWINYSLGRFPEAVKSFDEALAIRRARNDSTGESLCLYGIARVRYREGNLDQALERMLEVLNIVEPLRDRGADADTRTYYFANVQDYYEFYVDLLMQQEQANGNGIDAEMALAAHERARARELLAILAEAGEVSPRTGATFSRPLKAADIQSLLDGDTLLLEFALGAEKSYVWAVSNKDVRAYELPKRDEIEARALKLYNLLTSRNQTLQGENEVQRRLRVAREDRRYADEARTLSRELLGPVESLVGTHRLVIVAEGALQLIPFGALPVPNARSGKVLVIDHEIVNLPSASVLAALRKEIPGRAPAPKTLAMFADPVFTADDPRVRTNARHKSLTRNLTQLSQTQAMPDHRGRREDATSNQVLRRLLGTRWEAQQIGSLLPDNERLLALDFDASRALAMSGELASYTIIHFATHALINDSDPASSSVVLSQVDESGRTQNGSLTLHDIYELKVRANLAVLSACKTGLGTNVRGEGIRGLAGGFMNAGVPTVMVSLWPVNDRVTAEFMFRFYKLILSKRGISGAAALREVQVEMLADKRWRAAYFWAPFVIQGEWK